MFRTLSKLLDRKPRPRSERLRLTVEALEDRCLFAAVRTAAGFLTNSLAANDDGSTGLVSISFPINIGGATFSSLYVNNNGNVTFNSALGTFTPFDLRTSTAPIIAPFFADVDTRGAGSALVTYGTDVVDGRPAFGVNWVDVGYFNSHADKTNSFQLVLIDRSDVFAGAFDIEFNYDRLTWETGDASGGSNGFGGTSARAGFSAGDADRSVSAELTGSGVPGSLLDSNLTTALIWHSQNSNELGRYLFPIRTITNVYAPAGPPFGDRGDPRTPAGSAPASPCTTASSAPRRPTSPSPAAAWTGRSRAATAAASAPAPRWAVTGTSPTTVGCGSRPPPP